MLCCGKVVSSPLPIVARAMKALGHDRLRNLEPKRLLFCEVVASGSAVPVGEAGLHDRCRHQTASKVRMGRPPHQRRSSPRLFEGGAGYKKVHVAIDDATRLAYVEVLPDEQKATTVASWLGLSAGSASRASPACTPLGQQVC